MKTDLVTKSYRGTGRAAFLARLEKIKVAVVAGWPMTFIYDQHGQDMGLSYSQFYRYVVRYVRPDLTTNTAKPSVFELSKEAESLPQIKVSPEMEVTRRFVYKVELDDKESLI